MKIVKYAKYVGTMIGLEGFFHRWTAFRRNFIQRTRKMNPPRASWHDWPWVSGVHIRIWWSDSQGRGSCLAMHHCWSVQRLFLPICYVLDLHAALALTHLGSISSALQHGIERQPTRGKFVNGLAKIRAGREHDSAPIFAFFSWMGKDVLEDVDGSQHHGGPWISVSFGSRWQNCRLSQQIRNKEAPRFCSGTKSQNGTLPTQLLRVAPKPSDRLADTLRRVCLKCVMLYGLLAPTLPLLFYVFSATVCVRRSDSSCRVRSKDAELDVRMNKTPSRNTMNVFSCIISSLRFGGTL